MIRRIGSVVLLLLAVTNVLSAEEDAAALAKRLSRINWHREYFERLVVALRSSEVDFLMTPIDDDSKLRQARDPNTMRGVAYYLGGIEYQDAWDRDPVRFYEQVVRHIEEEARDMAAKLEARRNAERTGLPTSPPVASEGPVQVPRDFKNRPIITSNIIDRYIRVKFAATQSGGAPRRAGNFTQFDYDDVDKRIEWARAVKRSQGGEQLVPDSAVREHFSDEEVRVLNSRWRDLDNAQNGRWDELQSVITGGSR